MEGQILKLLNKVVESQTSMAKDLTSIKQDITSMKQHISDLREDHMSLAEEVHHHTIILENLDKKIRLTIEVQRSHMEQNAREHREIMRYLDEKTALLERVIHQNSSSLRKYEENRKAIAAILVQE